MLYGYRGLIVEWDYTAVPDCAISSDVAMTAYRLNGEDEASFPDEVDVRPDDFHRHYCPYRRLVGTGVVERFNRASTPVKTNVELRASSSLAEFVRRLQGSSYARDQIQPVYRPITVLPAGDYNDQRTGSRDDWYAMVDDRDRSEISRAQQPSVTSEYPTTAKVGVIVTTSTSMSSPLTVVPEVSGEDQSNGTEVSREPVLQFPALNGKLLVNGNGNVDHCIGDQEVVVDDVDVVRVNKPAHASATTVVTHTTIVRHVNGDAVNVAVDDGVGDVPANGGSVQRVICTTELPDSGADGVKTSTFGYVIDEANRRTIRSDL